MKFRDSLDTRFNFTWYFDGEEKFTSDTNSIYKKLPESPGDYSGIVEVDNGDDKLIAPSAKFTIKIK